MNLKNLATLKEKLVSAGDFAEVMDYFMTEFGEQMEFLDKGTRVNNEVLESILCEIGKQIFPNAPAVVLSHAIFVEIPVYHFTHGGLRLNGHLSTMFYFSDVQVGMLAVATSMTGPTNFLRFSGKLLKPNLGVSDN